MVDGVLRLAKLVTGRRALGTCVALLLVIGSARSAWAQYDVLTRNYNNQRTGATNGEETLTTGNVNAAQFTKLFSVPVDDQIYGQILVRQGVNFPGVGIRDAFYVVTVRGSLWAFDTSGNYLWAYNYVPSGQQATQIGDEKCSGGPNFTQYDALVGTPVIDPSTNIIYFIVRSKDGSGHFYQYLNAIDITNGLPKLANPALITATTTDWEFGNGSNTTFNPQLQNPRAALTLSNGYVYANWASFCDSNTYQGWTMGFNATTLAQTAVNITTASSGAGIWQGGGGMAVDTTGTLYAATGNGPIGDKYGYGYSLLSLGGPNLLLGDYFTSWWLANWTSGPSPHDMDFGSSGPVLLPPNFNVATIGAKDGYVYVLKTGELGGYAPYDAQIPQRLQAVVSPPGNTDSEILGTNVAWIGPDGFTYLYVWGDNDYPRRYRFDAENNVFDQPASDVGPILPTGVPGGMMTLSANDSMSGTGILWATTPASDSGGGLGGNGTLWAFNAENLALLWQSTDTWSYAKFNPPVVSNGQVYVPTFSNAVNVYGISRTTPVTSGQISILRKRNTTFPAECIDAPYASSTTEQLQIYPCNSSQAQDWQFTQVGSGTYSWQISRPAYGMCMDVPGGLPSNGLYQEACNNSPEQTSFAVFPAEDGLQIGYPGGNCVILPYNSSAPNTLLQLGPCLEAPTGADSEVFTAMPSQIRLQDSGLPGLCVDVPWGSLSPGQYLQIYSCNAGENQSWQEFEWGDGTQGLMRNGTFLCFDAPNPGLGSPVNQNTCNYYSDTQHFNLYSTQNGYIIQYNYPVNGEYLCVGFDWPGQPLDLQTCNYTDTQIFSLFPAQIRKATSGTAPGICLSGSGSSQMTYAPCDGSPSQNWALGWANTIGSPAGGCVGVQTSSPYSSESLYPNVACTSNPPNQWLFPADWQVGSDINMQNTGLCLDAPWGWNTVQNAQIFTCNGAASQQWTP